jgi:hypothetical protein
VATGLSRTVAARMAPVVQPMTNLQVQHANRNAPPSMVRPRTALPPDYAQLDRPTIVRQRAVGDGLVAAQPPAEELLDIPAFLRRQAD